MEQSSSTAERDRVAHRSGALFVVSMCVATVTAVVMFGIAFASCNRAMKGLLDFDAPGFGSSAREVKPIAIPQTSCPYLRLVAASAAAAGAPWHDSLSDNTNWDRFARELTEPLAAFDAALGAAVPNVPNAVAEDLRAVRERVETGRVELLDSKSVLDYMVRAGVFEGYTRLQHADALVGNACGVDLAPPLPF